MKDEILNILTMEDILNKYGIKQEKKLFHCPFHKDENASAKAYDNSFYCFSCNRTGDIIQFVQYLYNLSFKEAMQKINIDFNLGLKCNQKIDREKIRQIELEKKRKEFQKQQKNNLFQWRCNVLRDYYKLINYYKRKVNTQNWENLTSTIAYFQQQADILEYKIDNMY